jgi:2-oxoglutarate/2-oxoacid ferredoxin oxidoreductase subunit alpha
MIGNSFVIRVGGEAGQGLATATDILSKLFIKLGYHLFSSKEYMSQIKGGHNYHTLRISNKKVYADKNEVDLLLALDEKTILNHYHNMSLNGIIVHNEKFDLKLINEIKNKNITFISVPLSKIEENIKEKNLHNFIFLGTVVKCLGLEFNFFKEVLNEFFKKKPELEKHLLEAAQAGYDQASKIKDFNENKIKIGEFSYLNGNEAIALGALKMGLTFHAQYPMTPVTGILHYLSKESLKNKNLTVIQPEDEISTINMALGASYAGARAMTATSGGGFALMTESISLAGMAEIPLVIIEGQRPGPATGLPTKTEQGDLKFVINSGHGDFPKIVIAPSNIEECYTETKRAFYLAEKYQVPAIVLVDKHLCESFKTINLNQEELNFIFNYNQKINILNTVDSALLNSDGLFKRYQNNNLKRTIPGTENGLFTCTGDEHDEVGYITEDPEIGKIMTERRMSKLDLIKKELPVPKLLGVEDAELTIVCWGSNYGGILEAMERLNLEDHKVNFLPVKYMCPFQNQEIKNLLDKANKLVLIETNYSGQLADLIREKTGIEINDKILRYDGKTFTVDDIYEELNKRI